MEGYCVTRTRNCVVAVAILGGLAVLPGCTLWKAFTPGKTDSIGKWTWDQSGYEPTGTYQFTLGDIKLSDAPPKGCVAVSGSVTVTAEEREWHVYKAIQPHEREAESLFTASRWDEELYVTDPPGALGLDSGKYSIDDVKGSGLDIKTRGTRHVAVAADSIAMRPIVWKLREELGITVHKEGSISYDGSGNYELVLDNKIVQQLSRTPGLNKIVVFKLQGGPREVEFKIPRETFRTAASE